ncbi:MAG: 2-amino-4-hydroxy-6-hydroxymethyldihydropteridine diphosphokinase [Chloroflexota bacterium]|nr:2-amino-4-hydroxy-6-hydroxymethyldihydropteridine diphosphokinase [Chloroflexota bacterium]
METKHAILLLGSNIEREQNIRSALDFLRRHTSVLRQSAVWETEAVGSRGPNFLNVAVEIATDLDAAGIKAELVQPLESLLGRMRTADKNAPRTIDVDPIVLDGKVLDEALWVKAFMALPIAELLPDLPCPHSNQPLAAVAAQLKSSAFAEPFELP